MIIIIVVKKIVEWKQCLTKGVNMYKPGQHLPDAEADQVTSFENYHHTSLELRSIISFDLQLYTGEADKG